MPFASFIIFKFSNCILKKIKKESSMEEKFCLKWNDFQSNVSSSFDKLRKDRDFCDVSLVSEDGKHFESHKVILSSCSPVLKNILKKSKSGQDPFIFLNGIGSLELGFILDYIYRGEVQIFQNQIEKFLDSAQILKIDGLNSEGSEKTDSKLHPESWQDAFNDVENIEMKENFCLALDSGKIQMNESRKLSSAKTNMTIQLNSDSGLNIDELERKVAENIERENGNLICKICGHKSNRISNIKTHIETHIEGVSISCGVCDKTFRSRESLRFHKRTFH